MIIGDFYRSLKAELLGLSLDKDQTEHDALASEDKGERVPDEDRSHPDEPPSRRPYS